MALEWSDESIAGSHRLIQKVWRLIERHADELAAVSALGGHADSGPARELRRKTHQTIQRVTADIDERLHLNTAVSAFHELANEIHDCEERLQDGAGKAALREAIETLVLLMNPFTPHACEELWERLGHREGLVAHAWPAVDLSLTREDLIEMAVQINGKVRGHIAVPSEAGEDEIKKAALAEPKVREILAGQNTQRIVVVPGRLVSIVARKA
jgi:leucyl-tRNA synthetase